MVRNRQSWDLGEPGLNSHGLPIVHNIADKLGCIRPDRSINPYVPAISFEEMTGWRKVGVQDKDKQPCIPDVESSSNDKSDNGDARNGGISSWPESEQSYLGLEVLQAAIGSHEDDSNSSCLLQNQYDSINDAGLPTDMDQGTMLVWPSFPCMPDFGNWDWMLPTPELESESVSLAYLQHVHDLSQSDLCGANAYLMVQDFDAMKPDVITTANTEFI